MSTHAEELAAPLDLLLTSAAIGPMRRLLPPGNPKATYQINKANPPDPDEWLRTATTEQGSWWPDYAAWLGRRSGRMKAAPEDLGGGGLEPLEPAPGSYVRET